MNPKPTVVHSLIGNRNFEFYLKALSSLQFFSTDPVCFAIHSDGTLNNENIDSLHKNLTQYGSIRIINKDEANQTVYEALQNYPKAYKLRKDSIWAIELFDYHILEPNNLSFWCDADVRFFRPFQGLFTEKSAKNKCVFLQDTDWQAYSILPKHLIGPNRLKICSGINAGMNLLDKKYYDLEFIEWFLGNNDFFRIPEWVVPTCYASLGARSNGHVVPNKYLKNLYPRAQIEETTIGGHFLSSYRKERMSLFEQDWETENKNTNPIEVELEPCPNLTVTGYSLNMLKRKIANRLGIYL